MERLITTAISYPNGEPHIGHMYEAILSDMYNRLSILNGINSKLLTGTDEHGKKIQSTAEKIGITPLELCNRNSELFKQMLSQLSVKYDRFIRTTDCDHSSIVQEGLITNKDSITKSVYRSYYNVREETYVTPTEALLNEYKDPITEVSLEIREEESYMFDLPSFKEYILQNLHRVYGFNIESFRTRLDELLPLSISRLICEEFNWGIHFLDDSDHIVYVWFDALLNYITGERSLFEQHPQTIHVIGKDIVWFHSVIFPAITMKMHPIYDSIFVHGFVLDSNGMKMSKSLNNVITPNELLSEFDETYIRFYFIWETQLGSDIKFSKESLPQISKTILIDGFGNLFQRIYNLLKDIQDYPSDTFTFECNTSIEYLVNFSIHKLFNENIRNLNKRISDEKPWTMNVEDKQRFMIEVGSDFHFIMSIMSCVIPSKIRELNSYLGFNIVGLEPSSYRYVKGLRAFTI